MVADGRRRRSTLVLAAAAAFQFVVMCFAAATRVFIAPSLLIRFRDDSGNGDVATTSIHGDEGQIRGTDMLALIEKVVFHPDFYSHFHRSVEDAVNGRTKNHQISHMHGSPKIEMIDGSGDDIIPGVAMRRHRAGEIDPVHESSAQQSSQWIGIVGEDDFIHLRLRIPDWAGHHEVFPLFHSFVLEVRFDTAACVLRGR